MLARVQEPKGPAPLHRETINFGPEIIGEPLQREILLHVSWLYGFGHYGDALLDGPGEADLGVGEGGC